MKRIVLSLVFALALFALPGQARAATNMLADGHKFGLGLGGGSFTSGISGKAFLGQSLSVQAAAGTWWLHGIGLDADLLVEMPQIWTNGDFGVNWYVGAGAGVILGSPSGVGVAGVGGVSFQIAKFPIELTAEVRPTFVFANDWGGFYPFGGGGSVRYYF